MTTRRNFLKNSTMLAAGLGISPLLASAAPTVSHKEEAINGRVNIAVIGVGMGCRDLQGALTDNPWVHCVGMCDVNKVRLDEQIARFKKTFRTKRLRSRHIVTSGKSWQIRISTGSLSQHRIIGILTSSLRL